MIVLYYQYEDEDETHNQFHGCFNSIEECLSTLNKHFVDKTPTDINEWDLDKVEHFMLVGNKPKNAYTSSSHSHEFLSAMWIIFEY